MRNFKMSFIIASYCVCFLVGCGAIKKPQTALTETSSEYGEELKIAKDGTTGKLAFGAVFTLTADPDGMSLLITFKTSITDKELSTLPENLHWNIVGQREIAVPATAEYAKVARSALKIGQIKVKSTYSQARAILSLKDGMLLFGKTPQETVKGALYHINIGKLCQSSPELFSNLTNSKKCDEITQEDVGGL